jgi:polyhydroxybutyrate depolymerase
LAFACALSAAIVACSDASDASDPSDAHFTVAAPDAGAFDASPHAPGHERDSAVATDDGSQSPRGERDGEAPPSDASDTEPTDARVPADADGPEQPGTPDDDAGTEPPDSGAPPPMDCAGKPGAPGTTTRMYNGRSYIVHVPPDAHPNGALPVVFAFHGAGGKGSDMLGTGLDLLGDAEGFVSVFPDGAGNAPWNVGRGACLPGGLASSNADDFAYVEHMLDDIEQDQCIDRERVFATGFSMGGYFSHHIGCQRGGDLVRAVAPHSGGTYGGDCPGAPVPVLILHGDADPLISPQCAEQARDLWALRNGCAEDFDTIDLIGGHCEWHRACPARGDVVLCTFDGLEHNWAFPPDYDFSTLLIWEFFKRYL